MPLEIANDQHSDFRLDGKCAVVTAAARGLGRAVARTRMNLASPGEDGTND
jgi:hypothetical protein